MHAHPHEPPVDRAMTQAETIALGYQRAARGDTWAALVRAVEDGLADIAAAQEDAEAAGRLVSRGYVRGGLVRQASDPGA